MGETATGVSVVGGRVTTATWTGLVAVKVGSGVRVASELSSVSVPPEKREIKPQPRLDTNNKLLKKSHKRR
jgi:hypothetical protein